MTIYPSATDARIALYDLLDTEYGSRYMYDVNSLVEKALIPVNECSLRTRYTIVENLEDFLEEYRVLDIIGEDPRRTVVLPAPSEQGVDYEVFETEHSVLNETGEMENTGMVVVEGSTSHIYVTDRASHSDIRLTPEEAKKLALALLAASESKLV